MTHDVHDLLAAALARALAPALAPTLRALVRAEVQAAVSAPVDEWIPHTQWPVSSRRRACELARSGAIPARRQGRLWLARRADLDAWAASGSASTPRETSVSECEPASRDQLVAAALACAGGRRR